MACGSGHASRVRYTDRRPRANYRGLSLLGGVEPVELVEVTQIYMDDLPGG